MEVVYYHSMNKIHGDASHKHRASEWLAWYSMKRRCLKPNCTGYARYGARGIKIHEAWVDSYETFLSYVGRKPSADHSLDRINNNGNYEPGNVRWATRSQQAKNRNKRTITESFCRKMSQLATERYKTKPNPMKGKKHSPETLAKMVAARKSWHEKRKQFSPNSGDSQVGKLRKHCISQEELPTRRKGSAVVPSVSESGTQTG